MRRNNAFTLKEVLIGLAIVALLTALVIPLYQIARYRILEARCRANLWAIALKYKQLQAEYRGRPNEMREAFLAWMRTPEASKVIYCPLAESRGLRNFLYNFSDKLIHHYYCNPYNLKVRFIEVSNPNLIVSCPCHKSPIGRNCHGLDVMGEKYLAALDIGGEVQVRYANFFEIYKQITDPVEMERLFEECRRHMQGNSRGGQAR